MNSFKIPYFLFKYSEHDKVKDKLRQAILNADGQSVKTERDTITKTDWWHDGSWNEKDYIKILVENDFLKNIDREFTKLSLETWKLVGIWYQVYSKNDLHNWHKHGECQWSFVYYLHLPKNSKGTIVQDMLTQETIDLEQKEGDIFIFPSMMKHCSPINQDSSEKIVIAGNLDYHC